MAFNKEELLQLDNEEKRNLAFELLDSIDEDFINQPLPEWKRKLIEERLADDLKNPSDSKPWSEVRKKYFSE